MQVFLHLIKMKLAEYNIEMNVKEIIVDYEINIDKAIEEIIPDAEIPALWGWLLGQV